MEGSGGGYRALRSRRAVLKAIEECDAIGIDAFRVLHGFEEAHAYVLKYEGKSYDSKAIVGVAYGYQFPDEGPLKAGVFSSGKSHASRYLARLGFEVDGITLPSDDWTLAEVEAIVEAFFDFYRLGPQGRPNPKVLFNDVSKRIPNRSSEAIRRKLCNVNSVLPELGLAEISTLTVMPNRQLLLTALTYDWLDANGAEVDVEAAPALDDVDAEVAPPDATLVQDVFEQRRGCKVDFAARDDRNRKLGAAGEQWAVEYLRKELIEGGRSDLAAKVVWVSADEGDGCGYDILSYTPAGKQVLVEVKTTKGGRASPFFLSANEVAASERYEESFVLMRIFSFGASPKFYRLHGSLRQTCQLKPAAYRALPNPSVVFNGCTAPTNATDRGGI